MASLKVYTGTDDEGQPVAPWVEVRPLFLLELAEMADALAAWWARGSGDDETFPESMNATIVAMHVREQYRQWGEQNVWRWQEGYCGRYTAEEVEAWAERMVLAAYPKLGDRP